MNPPPPPPHGGKSSPTHVHTQVQAFTFFFWTYNRGRSICYISFMFSSSTPPKLSEGVLFATPTAETIAAAILGYPELILGYPKLILGYLGLYVLGRTLERGNGWCASVPCRPFRSLSTRCAPVTYESSFGIYDYGAHTAIIRVRDARSLSTRPWVRPSRLPSALI